MQCNYCVSYNYGACKNYSELQNIFKRVFFYESQEASSILFFRWPILALTYIFVGYGILNYINWIIHGFYLTAYPYNYDYYYFMPLLTALNNNDLSLATFSLDLLHPWYCLNQLLLLYYLYFWVLPEGIGFLQLFQFSSIYYRR